MNITEFENSLKKKIDSVFVLTGTDDFVKREALEKIKRAIKAHEGEEPEMAEFDASNFEIAVLLDELRTMPMFGGSRLVTLDSAEKLFVKRGAQKADPIYAENLKKYTESPSEFAVLVLIATEEVSRNKPSKFIKNLPGAVVLEARALYENEVPGWIRNRIGQYDFKASREVPEMLAGYFGTDLSEIDNALEKLALYAEDGEEVNSGVVKSFIKRRIGYDVFRFTDTIGTRNLKNALEMIGDIFDAGIVNQDGSRETNPVAIFQRLLPMIVREFKLYYSVRRAFRRTKNSNEVIKELGINPFVAKKAMGYAKNYSESDCVKAEREILKADNAIKTGELPDVRIALEKSLITIMKR